MLKALKQRVVRRLAIHTLNHALSLYDCTDDSSRTVEVRLLKLLEFDDKHHKDLPFDDKKVKYLNTLAKSSGHPALRTAELIFRIYITLFKKSYRIDSYAGSHDLNEFSYHYLTTLDIDLAPISSDDKFLLTLMSDM